MSLGNQSLTIVKNIICDGGYTCPIVQLLLAWCLIIAAAKAQPTPWCQAEGISASGITITADSYSGKGDLTHVGGLNVGSSARS